MASTETQWKRSSIKGMGKRIPKYLLRRFADFYKDAQGIKHTPKSDWDRGQAETLQMSIRHNGETYIESPESNRWIGKDGESLVPQKGKKHIQQPSTAIESIIIDKDETKGDQFKVSISFTSRPTKYYDYWATEKDIMDLINAASKGREVALEWNHNPAKHYP